MEQLGQTISLDEGGSQDFELDEPDFDDDFDEPEEPTAQIDKSDIDALKVRSSSSPEADVVGLRKERAGEATPIEAQVSKRPAVDASAVALINASRSFTPKSFLELLDASLSLK
jgi:hypothetical protein